MPLPNPNLDPGAAAQLQGYLSDHFSPTHQQPLKEQLDYGWHRSSVSDRAVLTRVETFFQIITPNTQATFGTGVGASIIDPGIPPTGGGDAFNAPPDPPPGGGNPNNPGDVGDIGPGGSSPAQQSGLNRTFNHSHLLVDIRDFEAPRDGSIYGRSDGGWVLTGALDHVTGPASSTDDALARFDGATGKIIQNSGWTLSDANKLTAAGELDLDGNKLVLSADGLSYIHSLTANLVDVQVGNVSIFTWQNNLVAVKVPLVLFGNDLEFGNFAIITSPATQQLNVVINSVITVDFRETQTTFLVDLFMGENEILLGDTSDTSIRGAADVATLKINGTDQVEWSDDLMEVGEAGAAYTISSKSSPIGGPGLFTVAGGDAIFEAPGGTLLLRGGPGTAATHGTVQLGSYEGTVRLEVKQDGTVDIRDTVIDEDLITLGDGGAPFTITSKSPATGLVPLLTLRGADAISGGGGGSISLRPGAKETSGVDGTVFITDKDGIPVLNVAATLVASLQDCAIAQGKRIDFDSAKTTSIRGSATELLLEILGNDQFVMTDDVLTLGDAGAAYLIVVKAPSAAVGLDLTVRAGSADGGNRAGGDLFLESGVGTGVGGDGDVLVRAGDGTVLAQFKISGEVDFAKAGMKINANGSIAGLPSIQVDSGGIIGFDNNNKWVLTENLLHSWTINSVLAMTLSDDTLDGQGTTRLANFKGLRETFRFGYFTVSTATTQWTYSGPYAVIMGTAAKRGAWMPRAGSIISVNIVCDVNVLGTGDTLEARVYKNNVNTGFAAELTGLTVADGLENENTQALGADTFVRGDYLQGQRVLTGASPGQVTTDDFSIVIEVEYDS